MSEWAGIFATDADRIPPEDILLRLLTALVLGSVVAWVYRRTRGASGVAPSFPLTLILLSVLIAMVTQVIGDNVARAFSLVGALSIVRFRTVVKDTLDTAFVIFAVVIGMAAGAADLWVAVIGIVVVSAASLTMKVRAGAATEYLLTVRMQLDSDPALLAPLLAPHLSSRELAAAGTAKQGALLELIYEIRVAPASSPDAIVRALTSNDRVASVNVTRKGFSAE